MLGSIQNEQWRHFLHFPAGFHDNKEIGEVPVTECGWDVYLHLHLLVSRNYVQLLR